MKKNKKRTLDYNEEYEQMLKEIGEELLFTDNTSHIIRYAIKFLYKNTIGASNVKD